MQTMRRDKEENMMNPTKKSILVIGKTQGEKIMDPWLKNKQTESASIDTKLVSLAKLKIWQT